jgi:hypothetical protein
MRSFILAIVVSAVGCASADLDPVAEQSQEATLVSMAYNETKSTWAGSSVFCHATYFGASGGSYTAPVWPSGIAKGGYFGSALGWLVAYPYDVAQGGHAYTGSRCYHTADFGITGGQSGDNAFGLLWTPQQSQGGAINFSSIAWSDQAFCHVAEVNSLDAADEAAYVDPPTGGQGWRYGVSGGVPKIGMKTKCIHPNRSWTLLGPYWTAGDGVVVGGPPAGNTFCAFTKVQGNLDDNSVEITNTGGFWNIVAHGGGASARMHCAWLP